MPRRPLGPAHPGLLRERGDPGEESTGSTTRPPDRRLDEPAVIATCRCVPDRATASWSGWWLRAGLRGARASEAGCWPELSRRPNAGAPSDGAERPAAARSPSTPETGAARGRGLSGGRHRACPDDGQEWTPRPQPEIRLDQLTGLRRSSPQRAPIALRLRWGPSDGTDAAENCPFDEGREDRTPPETWANRPVGGEPDTPGLAGPRRPQPLSGAGTDARRSGGAGGRGRLDRRAAIR